MEAFNNGVLSAQLYSMFLAVHAIFDDIKKKGPLAFLMVFGE